MNVLLIEDNINLCSIIAHEFKKKNIICDTCNDGNDALYYVMKQNYDIIILDRMLPHKDGITILKEIRNKNISTPVIILTAMDTIDNKIEGLDSGADDYLIKPFDIKELFARIRALTRRPAKIINNNVLKAMNTTLDINQYKLKSDTAQCSISKRECDLLAFLIKNKNIILSRETILTRIWGSESDVTDGNLDNFICFLRKRLKVVHSTASIKTIRGVGYKLEG